MFIGSSPNNTLSPKECKEHTRTWNKEQFAELFKQFFEEVEIVEMVTRQGLTPDGLLPNGQRLRPLPVLIGIGKKPKNAKDEMEWTVPEQPENKFEEFAQHISEFFDEDIEEVKRKMTLGFRLSRDAWNEKNPQSDEEKKEWYKTNKTYIFDLGEWHSMPNKRARDNHIFNAFKSEHEKGNFQAILDYGCGIGENAIELAEAGIKVVAADLDSTSMEFAKFRAKKKGLEDKITFVPLDAPFEGEPTGKDWLRKRKFDAAICFDVLEHLPSTEEIKKTATLLLMSSKHVFATISMYNEGGAYPMHLEDDGKIIPWLQNAGVQIIPN